MYKTIKYRFTEFIRDLYYSGAKIKNYTIIVNIAELNDLELIKFLFEHYPILKIRIIVGQYIVVLPQPIKNGRLDILQFFLEEFRALNPNPKYYYMYINALYEAFIHNKADIVEYLINYLTELNIPINIDIGHFSNIKYVLMENNNLELLKYFIENRSILTSVDDNELRDSILRTVEYYGDKINLNHVLLNEILEMLNT